MDLRLQCKFSDGRIVATRCSRDGGFRDDVYGEDNFMDEVMREARIIVNGEERHFVEYISED